MELSVAITALDDDGRGVGAAEGLERDVSGALPGEHCRRGRATADAARDP